MPSVSVIIPCYNQALFLNRAIDSVIAQSYKNWECIIVNDGSTDESLSIIQKYAEIDSRIRYISISNSGCANIPRQVGVAISKSDWICYLDSDDYITSAYIEKLYNKANKTSSDIVLGRMVFINNQTGKELWSIPSSHFNMDQIISGKKACSLTIGGWEIATNGLIKRELLNNIPVGNLTFSDELNSRFVLINAKKITFCDVEYYYRIHPQSITHKISIRLFDILLIDQELEDFTISNFSELDDTSIKMRKARLFNLIFYQILYFKIKKSLKNEEIKNAKSIIKRFYKKQNFRMLKKELPIHWRIAFLTSYLIFILGSIMYYRIKPLKFQNLNSYLN